jgi:hypothetical protein
MPVVATVVSRDPVAWDEPLVGVVAAVLTDGDEVRVVGSGREALALVLRAREIFRADEDPALALWRLVRRSVSSYETISKPRYFNSSLDEAAGQLADELDLPVVPLTARAPATR